MKNRYRCFALVLFFVFLSFAGIAQSPGIIVRPATGHVVTPLNPDGNAYSSKTTSGFASNDISESEIPFKIVPPAIIEPTGDLATGPSGGFTDIVKTVDGSGFYLFKDATNLYFRLRIGGIISGSKGYSILIDTDGKIGNSGPNADPNYIAPTNTSNGNPGFEYEVVFRTNFEVTVYNVDGTTSPTALTPAYGLNSHAQISVALSTDGGNPDYFYDWFVPLTAVGNPASIRMVATTVTSPTSALQGSRSDIYGIDDAANTNVASAWTTAVGAQPSISLTNFSSYTTNIGNTCTAAPTLNSPITTGTNITVSGTWTRMDASKPSTATITLYKNDVAQTPTVSVTSGGNWSITVPSITSGDVFYAKAQASGESMCLESNKVTGGCATTPTAPTITCASTKGLTGTIPLGATVEIYQVTTTNGSVTATPLTTNLIYTDNATNRTFNYYGTNSQTGGACSSNNNLFTSGTTLMFITNNNGCKSVPLYGCVTGSNGTSTLTAIGSNDLVFNTPIYAFYTVISGTSATGFTAGQVLRLIVNNVATANYTVSAATSTFRFENVSVNVGDDIRIMRQTSGSCISTSATVKVSCYAQPPIITTDASGRLMAGATSISGTSTAIGATVTVYRGTAPSGTSVGTATVNASGNWSLSTSALALNENYYATQTVSGCVSAPSTSAPVFGVTTVCPAFTSPTYAIDALAVTGTISTTFSGVVKLYLDGVLIGTTAPLANPNSGTWSITVNTNASNIMYPNGVLTANTEATGAAEKSNCGVSAIVSCTSPSTPVINPTSSSINVGNSVTYTIRNANSDTWYAIQDNSGKSFATSVYRQNTNDFTITTNPINTAGTYDLRITADKLTGCAATFSLARITASHVALPVRFVEVTVKSQGNKPQVTWQVADEQNVAFYSIEKSYDGSFFEEGGKTPYKSTATDINTYTFTDQATATEEMVYYRIKQVDKEGKYIYSKIVSLKLQTPSAMQLVPNPAYDKTEVQVVINRPQSGWLQLVDPSGALVKKQSVTLKKGLNKIPLEGLQQFGNGTYFVQVVLPDGTLYKKLLLQ